MRLDGIGTKRIARLLNQDAAAWKPEFTKKDGSGNKSRGWRASYVTKVLGNEAVIGRFQPHKVTKGQRKPIGEPVEGYYPPIVDGETFHRVCQLKRTTQSGGRTGKARNLLTYRIKCGFCGAPMHYVDKGTGPKAGPDSRWLICDHARRGVGCERHPIRYSEAEEIVLSYCKGLEPADILPGDGERKKRVSQLRATLEGMAGEAVDMEARVENLTEQAATANHAKVRDRLQAKLAEYLDRQAELAERQAEVQSELEEVMSAESQTTERLESLRGLIDKLNAEPDNVDLRMRTRQALQQLIECVSIRPVRFRRCDVERFKEGHGLPKKMAEGALEEMEKVVGDRAYRRYQIIFKGGSQRIIKPGLPMPLRLDYDRERGEIVLAPEAA